MQGKTLYTILLAIIAVLTLAVAVLAIFLFTALNGAKASATPSGETETQATQRVAPPEEQAEFNLYATGEEGSSNDAIFNIKSTEDHPNSFLMASIKIVYDGGPKNSLLDKRKTLLEKTYLSDLRMATIEYFRNRSFDDLQAPDAMQKARESLKTIYNGIIASKPKDQFVIKIIFDKWLIQ